MNRQREEIPFTVKLESDEPLSVRIIAETLRDIENMLSDIEKHIFNTSDARAQWKWPDEAELEVVATVNGLDRAQLSRIVEEAERGFTEAKEAKGSVNWPSGFGPAAQDSARKILGRLEKLNSIIVRAEDRRPVTITTAEIGKRVTGKLISRRCAYSSVEGRLELISHRGKLRAAVKENVTDCVVQCTFSDELLDVIKELFDKRVVVEGLVNYRENGEPISITKVSSVTERKHGAPLRDFIGSAPDITGGVSSDEFIARLRG